MVFLMPDTWCCARGMKGKPSERSGRKVSGLGLEIMDMTAGLPDRRGIFGPGIRSFGKRVFVFGTMEE